MISMIAAIGKNNELGKKNDLIWHIPDDMKFFKETTFNHTVVMGYNTYKSLPGPLKDRNMIVISDKEDKLVETINDPKEIVDKYLNSKEEIFIIGGASIYKYFIDYAKNLYLTEINAKCNDADIFFPKFNKRYWKNTILKKDTYKNIKYSIHKYTKK